MGTIGKRYPAEYRRQMVKLVHSGRTAGSLGREFESSAETTFPIRRDCSHGPTGPRSPKKTDRREQRGLAFAVSLFRLR